MNNTVIKKLSKNEQLKILGGSLPMTNASSDGKCNCKGKCNCNSTNNDGHGNNAGTSVDTP